MATDQIRYDLLVQEALRGVVRKVLANAARDGLPGEHYFHVEFETAASGVRLSDRMRERFPDRMTIILQHHFWDLEVTEEAMEVGLSFGGVAERVRVPFAALTGFFDESVQFGLRYQRDQSLPEPRSCWVLWSDLDGDEEKGIIRGWCIDPATGTFVTRLSGYGRTEPAQSGDAG